MSPPWKRTPVYDIFQSTGGWLCEAHLCSMLQVTLISTHTLWMIDGLWKPLVVMLLSRDKTMAFKCLLCNSW